MVNHFCVQKYSQMLPSQITFAAEVSEYIVKQFCWVFFRYNRCPHHCPNGHEQFAIEIFFWWSRVSTIRRTTLCQRYDKESLSIHCQKVWSKTKHFAWYFPSVCLEGHSFFLSYWLLMPVLTIPALILRFGIINNCLSLFFCNFTPFLLYHSTQRVWASTLSMGCGDIPSWFLRFILGHNDSRCYGGRSREVSAIFLLFLLELIVFQVFFVPLHPKHQEQSLLADSPTEF